MNLIIVKVTLGESQWNVNGLTYYTSVEQID